MKIAVAYLIMPPIGAGLLTMLLPPIAWSVEFLGDWLFRDSVIALVNIEANVRGGNSPGSAFVEGALGGLLLSAGFLVARWYNRSWPHER